MSGDYEAVLEQAATTDRIKVAHAAMALEDPTTYKFSTHVDSQQKQIVASLATKAEGATTESYVRTQCLVPGVISTGSSPG
jgi:hypothetical protein